MDKEIAKMVGKFIFWYGGWLIGIGSIIVVKEYKKDKIEYKKECHKLYQDLIDNAWEFFKEYDIPVDLKRNFTVIEGKKKES